MGASYYQFCPIAKAMELLDERWTMLIVRELLLGSEHFNDIRRGVPRMSPTLLSKRLDRLVRAGIAERHESRYLPTEAGRELLPVVEMLSQWGIRWIGEIGDEDLDPKLLLWDMRRHVIGNIVPEGRTVLHFHFDDVAADKRHWWLIVTPEAADLCDADPGFDVNVDVAAQLRSLTRVWRGDSGWPEVLRSGEVSLTGPSRLCRSVPTWFDPPRYAGIPRP
ncbi:MAG: winged helix-turn-helix transcriptional regulator [Mycobacterium sp.]